MDWTAEHILRLLYELLPGFLAAWIFYSLTAHPKPSSFERIVQALVFTIIVRAGMTGTRLLLQFAGVLTDAGTWTQDVQLTWSVITALAVGLLVATSVNKDWFHGCLRRIGLTSRTSFPSEWYSGFTRSKRHYVVLHLNGERRLYGWPEEWPDSPERGHFLIMQAKWLLDDGKTRELDGVERLAIPAADVEMVEFLKYTEE